MACGRIKLASMQAEAAAKAAGQSNYNPLMQTSKTYKLYPGDIKFEDLNGNGYIDRGQNTVDDPGDRKIIGNEEPRYIIVLRSLPIGTISG